MTPSEMTPDTRDIAGDDTAERFIAKWNGVGASELSTSQSFLIDLCHLLGVDTPHPTPEQGYMFERPITFAYGDGSTSAGPGRIDRWMSGMGVNFFACGPEPATMANVNSTIFGAIHAA